MRQICLHFAWWYESEQKQTCLLAGKLNSTKMKRRSLCFARSVPWFFILHGTRESAFARKRSTCKQRARVTSVCLSLSPCGAQVWIRQPAVTADHESCQPGNFSRQSRFIGNCFQARLMPGLRWRIALCCSHWAWRLRLTPGRAIVTGLITAKLCGKMGDAKHKAPLQSTLFIYRNWEWAPDWRIWVQ